MIDFWACPWYVVPISDHHYLCFDLLHKKPEFQKEEFVIRNFKKINVFEFQKDMKSQFDEIMGLECVEHLTETFWKVNN